MATDAQRKAVKTFRSRRRDAGITRFEVAAPDRDKDLVRGIARRLVEAGPRAEAVRSELRKIVAGAGKRGSGGIWRALRQSPLVGAEVEFPREPGPGRKVQL